MKNLIEKNFDYLCEKACNWEYKSLNAWLRENQDEVCTKEQAKEIIKKEYIFCKGFYFHPDDVAFDLENKESGVKNEKI